MIGSTISNYRIIEKLGEGGMGIVYKAHDTSLDRIIALKFLPHYLTSDTGEKERFYHEARAASALNHPNITTIFEIKEFEHQLFLAMEYVEGKTLKKLIEEDSPSIKKVLEVAIQAADGLAAAHEKGVVHRDIKSDNIMITPKGQVKIMDFGLAKIKGSAKLTKAGSTIGTAAYMSPEQAQGEEVDHRSDIFSFGVVLYELLTSKLPFRGEHQAAMMYSLMNEEPAPIARFNEKVTPEIERIVSKALVKDKEERYQHVDDLLADLRRERKHFEYARAGYTTMSTAAQPVAAAAAPPPALPPKKNILKFVIPASVIVLAVILLVIFNPLNFQVTTQKSTAGPAKNSLAVMYFENIPNPDDKDHTGEMLTNLLTTSLFQTKDLEVISRERLYDIQKDLVQGDSRVIPPAMATKIAQRAGVSMMLLGTILQQQPSLTVTYRLIEVQSGKILSTQRLSGFGADKVFSLVDTLALLVKNDLNIASGASSEDKSIASVTTTSPEAYRSYLEGLQFNDKYFNSEAKAAYNRAIELDSNFAMAYFGLVTLALEQDQEMKRAALIKAWQLSERVTEKERLKIQAAYSAQIENNIEKAISIGKEILQKYPREQRVYNGLAVSYISQFQFENAVEISLRGLQHDSHDGELWNELAYLYSLLNRKAEAVDAIDHYVQLFPGLPNPYDSKAEVYVMFGDLDSAFYWYQKAVSFKSDFPSSVKMGFICLIRGDYANAEKYIRQFGSVSDPIVRAQASNILAALPAHRGKLQEAELLLRRNLDAAESQQLTGPKNDIYYLLIELAYQRGDYPAMLNAAKKYSSEQRKSPDATLYGRNELALAYLKNKNTDMFSKLVEEIRKDVSLNNAFERTSFDYMLILAANEIGEYDSTLEHFRKLSSSLSPNHAPLLPIAVANLKTGHIAESIDELKRLAGSSPIDMLQYGLSYLPTLDDWLISSVKAHYWLGVAYEQEGKKENAIMEYETFLNIWKEADFKSKELDDAKNRLAKLTGVASK